MIELKQEGSKVVAHIAGKGVIAGWSWPHSLECATENYAKLLRQNLADHLFSSLQQIRRAAYEEGYADKKARRPKRDYFKGVF